MKSASLLTGIAAAAIAAGAHGAFIETFEGATLGANIGAVPGFFGTAGSAWSVIDQNGVAGSKGVSNGDQGFNWTAHSFDWSNLAVGDKIVVGADFQASSTGRFDDDRIGWAISPTTSTSSNNHFGVQLDTNASSSTNVGVVSYWKNASNTTFYQPIINFSSAGIVPAPNSWYQARATFTKIENGMASIDVTLQALDAAGDLTGSIYTGSIADPSTYGTASSKTAYFSGTASPTFKTFRTEPGSMDNVYFSGVIPVPEPASLSLLMLGGLLLGRRRSA